jgi:tetratricopeptide (TPR) repeat protein
MRPMRTPAARPTLSPPRAASEPALAAVVTTAAEPLVVRAERLVERHHYTEAVAALVELSLTRTTPELALRAMLCEGWARMYLGELLGADDLFERARAFAEGPTFTDLDRAEATFRLGCVRLKLGKVSNAVSLLTVALGLAEQTGHADRLRSRILDWRSRCHQLQRDWDAAQADAEHALELAEAVSDLRLQSLSLMQCSLVAERRGNPLLARFYGERAREHAAEVGDRQTEARITNNLGGLSFLVGDVDQAVSYLKESFGLSLELGNDADAAQAVSSLAQVHLRTGALKQAEEQARQALRILDGRDDYLDERGNAHLVVGRALLAQGRNDAAVRELEWAEDAFTALGSVSHVAAAWVAQGDARRAAGDADGAADLYRRAADALQDFRF